MGLSYVPAISAGLLLPTGILQQIGQQLGDTENIIWIPGGWSVASAVAFSIAGGLSDVFGRRWVLMAGQFLTLIGGVSSELVELVVQRSTYRADKYADRCCCCKLNSSGRCRDNNHVGLLALVFFHAYADQKQWIRRWHYFRWVPRNLRAAS